MMTDFPEVHDYNGQLVRYPYKNYTIWMIKRAWIVGDRIKVEIENRDGGTLIRSASKIYKRANGAIRERQ